MIRTLVKSLVLGALVLGVANFVACNGARDTAFEVGMKDGRGFIPQELVRGDRHRTFYVFVPMNYNDKQKYPVIVFLHGVGEGGSDGKACLRVGLAPFVADRAYDFPFICIFPQSAGGGWSTDSDEEKDIFSALDVVEKTYKIDRDRISLTGLSTGGVGTWAIGGKNSDKFCALVPMGSNGTAEKWVPNLLNTPVHAYCNGGDMFAGFTANDSGMVDKIKALGGTKAEFTKTDGPGHDCWEGVYADGELFTWMAAQRLNKSAAAPAKAPTKG